MKSTGPGCVTVLISSLLPADSPRSEGENKAHIVRLAESYDRLPPILVHRDTMHVIDGMHRVRAASLRGHTEIAVEFFDGSLEDAFLRAVELNVSHGLPLSLPDRKAAAARILRSRPDLSDRAIASISGLSDKTVAAIRSRSNAENPHLLGRIGADGRIRPVDPARGRRRAAEILAKSPRASLREVAAAAGVSPATVRDVRRRVQHGLDPVGRRQPVQSDAAAGTGHASPHGSHQTDAHQVAAHKINARDEILPKLSKDPSLRFTETGRKLLRWLHGHAIGTSDWSGFVDSVPQHCAPSIAELARKTADAWNDLAYQLERRTRVLGTPPLAG